MQFIHLDWETLGDTAKYENDGENYQSSMRQNVSKLVVKEFIIQERYIHYQFPNHKMILKH